MPDFNSDQQKSYEIQSFKKGGFTYVLLEALKLRKNQCFTVGA